MVVLYCPACSKKVLIKGVQAGEYPVDFIHCGHRVSIDLDKKEKKSK